MPIYDFMCSKCKAKVSDVLVSAHNEPQYCQVCGAKMKRLPSSANIRFKGEGFYKNDYQQTDNDYQKDSE